MYTSRTINIVCRVQKWIKSFCQNREKFGYSFNENGIIFMYILCIYKKTHILSPFKTDILNFIMYISTF